MERFMHRWAVILVFLGTPLTTWAQNTEYYKKDTLREQPRQTTMEIPQEETQ